MRRILGPIKDEVTAEWRRLHNEKLHALYSLPKIIWVIELRRQMRRACSMYGGEERTAAYRVLVEKPKGRRPPGRSRCRQEYDMKMDLREEE
jgi:hypothetical protein